ncbi:MAG: aspartate aminotransferase family protein [Thermomicrobiales bacterium]|nr:aspartate aminotransferase family protein [Thermomicrobiales bacterium]
MPVAATSSPDELFSRLDRPVPAAGVDPVAVIDDLVADVAGGVLGSAGGRFFAWVIGGSWPAALGADWLTSTWDQNAALHACGPAVAIIEEVAGSWLKDILGLPTSASFAFTTGSQLAHVTCLAAARHALLERAGWQVEPDGLRGAPRMRILTSTEAHGSIDRAVRLLGLGTRSIERLSPDAHGRMTPAQLDAALAAEPGLATVVVLQAGDLNIGAFDPFAELIPIAHAHGAWVHIDGAFGLWAAASPRYRTLLTGVESADSWVTDGHKWLNVPYDSGFAFVADPAAHAGSMSHRASYTIDRDGWRGQIDWNPEWSRRGRGVATYAAIRELGRAGLADLVDRTCRHAHALVTGIGSLPGTEIVWMPTLNQGLVRFTAPRPEATPAEHDAWTDRMIETINAGGEAFFSGTTWRGRRCMRVSVVNWRTSDGDVVRAVAAMERALAGMR